MLETSAFIGEQGLKSLHIQIELCISRERCDVRRDVCLNALYVKWTFIRPANHGNIESEISV